MHPTRSHVFRLWRTSGVLFAAFAGLTVCVAQAQVQGESGTAQATGPRVGHSMSHFGADSPAEQRASIRRFLELFALDVERGRVGLVATGAATLFEMFAGGAAPPSDLVTVRRDLDLPTE